MQMLVRVLVRVVTTNFRSLCQCLNFSRAFVNPSRSHIIPALTCNHRVQKSGVVSLSTERETMPKKGKIYTRGAQEDVDTQTQEGKEGILSVISAAKDGQICVKILAKPGAKQSSITGNANWGRVSRLDKTKGGEEKVNEYADSPSPLPPETNNDLLSRPVVIPIDNKCQKWSGEGGFATIFRLVALMGVAF